MRDAFKKLLLVLLSVSFIITGGCNKQSCSQSKNEFQSLTSTIFKDNVNCDTLSLNYSIANPKKYGITPQKPTLGEYSAASMEDAYQNNLKYLDQLSNINCEALPKDEQLTYEILQNYLQEDTLFHNYLYYNECIRPTTGIQAQLPILLAEYNFYTKEDITTYLELLPCIEPYFKSIIKFEQEKAAQGLFMSDYLANQVISQCEAFISDPDSNYLIEYFNHRIDEYPSLTKKERAQFKLQNEEAVKKYVLPAYQELIDSISSLKGSGKNTKGLYYLPNGAEYYSLLASYMTGSSRSMKEMASMLQSAIDSCYKKTTSIVNKDSRLLEKYIDFQSFPLTEPDEILEDLKSQIKNDFPALPKVECDIKYVDSCLSDYLSPAMYLVPAMDNYKSNNIYINGNDEDTLSYIYATVAHEGYPGHLYQCVYYRSTNPDPIRHTLNFSGYDEGWATYVELCSYGYAGIDKNLAEFFSVNNLAILCMYARADIGIHYEGWDLNDTKNYLSQYIDNEHTQIAIYSTLLKDPAAYLPYAIGCLEFLNLKQTAMKELGDDFDLKEFHTFLLDMGPCQFYIIDKHMQEWITSQKRELAMK